MTRLEVKKRTFDSHRAKCCTVEYVSETLKWSPEPVDDRHRVDGEVVGKERPVDKTNPVVGAYTVMNSGLLQQQNSIVFV